MRTLDPHLSELGGDHGERPPTWIVEWVGFRTGPDRRRRLEQLVSDRYVAPGRVR